MRDGRVLEASVDGPFGHGAHPASDADLVAKWHRLTGGDGSGFLERLCSGNAGEPFAAIGDELPAVARLLD